MVDWTGSTAAAVGGVLAARPVPAEGEAAPGRGGCPGDGVAVGQQVPGNTAHTGGVPARVVLRVAGRHLALVVLLPCGALGAGEGLLAVQARPRESRERGVAGALVGGVPVGGRGGRAARRSGLPSPGRRGCRWLEPVAPRRACPAGRRPRPGRPARRGPRRCGPRSSRGSRRSRRGNRRAGPGRAAPRPGPAGPAPQGSHSARE